MQTLTLIRPTEEYADEIRSYRQECLSIDGHSHGDSGLSKFQDPRPWIAQCRLLEHKETLPNPGWVEADQFMLVREGEHRILGMINFRHELNGYLAECGGHIGYGVRPSERRKGYAKAMLLLCLDRCREFGLDRVLITCSAANEASRRTILSCGGVFDRAVFDAEDQEDLERYWVAPGPLAACPAQRHP